jgi:hypothetical protein
VWHSQEALDGGAMVHLWNHCTEIRSPAIPQGAMDRIRSAAITQESSESGLSLLGGHEVRPRAIGSNRPPRNGVVIAAVW